AERAQACIITDNYGEAGALQFLGTRYGLPPVLSGHNSYWLWGPGACSGRVLIVVNGDLAQMHGAFGRVVLATTAVCHYCMPYEDNLPIYLCTRPTFPRLQDAWPAVKHYN